MLARALRNQGRYDEALPLAESAADVSERLFGPDDYSTLVRMSTVASIHDFAGRCDLALPIARTVRERMAARYGEARQATLVETGNLGFRERDCGDRDAGIAWLRQAESGLRRHYGEDNVAAHSFRYALAHLLADEGRYAEAMRMAEGLDLGALTAASSTPVWDGRLRALRGRILVLSGDAAAGRPLLAEAVQAMEAGGFEDEEDIAPLRALLAGSVAAGDD